MGLWTTPHHPLLQVRGIRGDVNDKRTRAFAVEKVSDILPQNKRSQKDVHVKWKFSVNSVS